MTTYTAATARIAAATTGHWTEARKIESDLPGVSYLQLTVETTEGTARVEVYAPEPRFGAASVILGGMGNLTVPTDEMIQAFLDHGCSSIFA